MKPIKLQNLSAVARLRVAALLGLSMFGFVVVVRMFMPATESDPTMPTRILAMLALAWFALFAKPDSHIERHLFMSGAVLSTALLIHLMFVNWLQANTSYFFVSLIVMSILTAAALSLSWIRFILLTWTCGLLTVVLLSPMREGWLGYVMMMYPLAVIVYLLANSLFTAKLELEQQRIWLEKSQNVSRMAGWERDLTTGEFTWSPSARQLFEIDDLETVSVRELVGEEDWQRIAQAVERCLQDGEDFEVILEGKKEGLKERWWSIKAGVAGDARHPRLVGVFVDVTDTVVKERELTRAKEAAETAVVARTRFLANMSHEIRTPMNGVIGMASLLLDGDLGSKERSYAEIIRNSGESLLTIINQILDFSKYEAGNVTLEEAGCHLEQLVTEALDIVDHNAHQKGLKLHLDMPVSTNIVFRGDGPRLRQVMVNLLSNAVKFTETGSVSMQIRLEEADDICQLRVEVADTGIGITPAALPNLFDPFVQGDATTTRRFGGTGLGLAISREILQAMGGEIDVYSHPKTGSKFTFQVPLEIIKREPVPHVLDAPSQDVFMVTEDPDLVDIIDAQLTEMGMNLVSIGSVPDLAKSGGPRVIVDTDFVDSAVIEDLAANPDLELILLGPLNQRSRYAHLQSRWLRRPVLPSQLMIALGLKEPVVEVIEEPGQLEQFNHLRVLLAEDNAINQKVAQQMLKKLGCMADIAQNGRETLHMMSEKEYDLVFMDVQMPEVDGLEATRLIRVNNDFPQPYIIAMTANVMQEDREVCRLAGMDDFVAKPVRIADVSKALRRASNQINSS